MWDLIVSVPDHCLSFYFSVNFGTKHKNMRFAQLNISILQDNTTVDLSNVLLKIILVPYVRIHRCYIEHHAQPSLVCENENLVQFHDIKLLVDLLTITRFIMLLEITDYSACWFLLMEQI